MYVCSMYIVQLSPYVYFFVVEYINHVLNVGRKISANLRVYKLHHSSVVERDRD